MPSPKSSLQTHIDAILTLTEELRGATLEEPSGHHAAILALDRLCDAVVTARWEMLQAYRARYGREDERRASRPAAERAKPFVPSERAGARQ